MWLGKSRALTFSTAIGGMSWVPMLIVGAAISPATAEPSRSGAEPSVSLPPVTVDVQRRRPPRVRQAVPQPKRAVPVQRPVEQQPVERANGPVVGYVAGRSATATKTDTPILETPQSISVVTKDQIQAQGAQNVNDALRYTPGVSLESFGANAFFDAFKLRGFDAPRYLDGLRLPQDTTTFASAPIELYGLERLEVLKGPSSGIYGQSDPGGLLNMVSKRPTATPQYEVVGSIGSFNRFQGAFDFSGPIDKNGEFLYRIVGLGRKSDTQTDFTQDNKIFIAPSFTWRPTNDTSFTILGQYQKIDNKGYQQYIPAEVSFRPNPNGQIPYSRYLGEPGPDGYKLEQAAIGYAFEHRFNERFQFRQNLRYMDVTNDLASTRSEGMAFDSIENKPSDRSVNRSYNYVKASAKNLALDNQLQADFTTGPLRHKVLVGLDYFNLKASTDYRFAFIDPIDAYNPVYGATAVPSFDSLPSFILRDDKQSQTGLYLQDQIKLDRWTLSLTGRQDWASTEFTSLAFFPVPGTYSRSDAARTGRVGLNYLFDFGLSPYASYSTSFTPNLGADASGNGFKPTTGEGVEAGIKFKPNGMNLLLTAAVFEINQNDVLTPGPDPSFSVQTDAVRVRGVEFEAKGNITRELEIVAGFSHVDPVVTKSRIATNVGKIMVNTARDQAALWGKYTWYDGPLAGLGLGAGIRYVGPTFGDATNSFEIPSYTLIDAVVSYDLAYMRSNLKGWKAQINATNLTDRYYVASCLTALAYCSFGNARTVLGTLKYSWN